MAHKCDLYVFVNVYEFNVTTYNSRKKVIKPYTQHRSFSVRNGV